MTKPPKLKPCPFCEENDQEVLLIEQLGGKSIHPAFRIVCENCGASTGYTDRGDHIAAWNTRRHDPAVLALVEAAREMSAAFYSNGNVTERHAKACRAGLKLDAALAAFDNIKENK